MPQFRWRKLRTALAFGGFALLTACSATGPAQLSDAELSREASFQRQLALEEQVQNQRRLDNISFRLMEAAADFCGEHKVFGYGFRAAGKHSFGDDLVDAAQELYGLDTTARILSVVPDSPAARAGLVEGDVVTMVGEAPLAAGKEAVSELRQALRKAGSAGATLRLAGANPRQVHLKPSEVCGYPIVVMNSDKVNAYADGQRIRVTKGMLWFVNDDAELAMVLAHELAHNVMGHAGTFRSIFEDKKSREADADYVGLYIMARAGFQIEKAPNFWRRVAAAFPRMIESSSSHPIMPYRFVALRKTTEEIRALEASGRPLVPRRVDSLPVGPETAALPE